jgi:hypothetical protein
VAEITRINGPNFTGNNFLHSISIRLCLGGLLLVLERGLLEIFRGICCGILLLVEFGFGGGASINSLVLLCGLAGGVCGAVRALVLLSLEALNLLLRLGDVLYDC